MISFVSSQDALALMRNAPALKLFIGIITLELYQSLIPKSNS